MVSYFKISAIYIVGFWAVWHFANLFELANDVSAFYPAPALTIALIGIYGPRYFPAVCIAVTVGSLPQHLFWEWGVSNLWHLVRHAFVYGIAGMFLYKSTKHLTDIGHPKTLIYVLLTATVSSGLSAMWAGGIFHYFDLLPKEVLIQLTFGFWTGDLSGILLILPLILIYLKYHDELNLGSNPMRDFVVNRSHILLVGWIISTLLFIQVLIDNYELHNIYVVFVFIPVVIAGVLYGVIGGALAALTCSLGLSLIFSNTTVEHYTVDGVQALLIAVCVVGIVVGSLSEQNKRYYRNLIDKERELSRVSRISTMGELGASIAHEISTPLQAAVLNAQM